MKSYIIAISALVLIGLSKITPIYAQTEVALKAGYANILCDGIGSSPVLSASIEKRNKLLGIELGIAPFFPYIYSVGQFISTDIYGTVKLYMGNFYIGGGIGYIANSMLIEDYPDELSNKPVTTIDNEIERHLVAGLNRKGYFIEVKRIISDLDIETGIIDFEPQIEKRSRLDNWQVLVGKRFKF